MKKKEVVIGNHYVAAVSGKETVIKITGESRFGGWDAFNLQTSRTIRIKSAQRLRYEVIRNDEGKFIHKDMKGLDRAREVG